MTPEFMRLFVALPVPPKIRAQIAKFARELDNKIPAEAVRWTPQEQIHLTLRFLGKVEATAVPELEQALNGATRDSGPISLEAAGLGAFPSLRNPRVIWIGLQGDTALLLPLQQRIADATAQWCEKDEKRKFSPHLTIGRVRDPHGRGLRKISAALQAQEKQYFGEWRPEEVLLMRSQLSPHGATHMTLAKWPL